MISALELQPGNIVADLGCGSGYFALKLSPVVERNGRVLAIDIGRLSLAFLQARALLAGPWNITAIHGDSGNPKLLRGSVNAVLIANTYHELQDRKAILNHILRALVPGGRLVIIDRVHLHDLQDQSGHKHQIAPEEVEREILDVGFQSVIFDDHFIEMVGQERWRLIAMRRP